MHIYRITKNHKTALFRGLLTIYILFYCSVSNSQISWENLTTPDSIKIICVGINADNDIFLGTRIRNSEGALYRSNDFGSSWEYLDFYPHSVVSIEMDEFNHIYCGSRKNNDNGIYKSIDNGDNWEFRYYTQIIGDITYYREGLLYAFGHKNGLTILKSFNYGLFWEEYPLLPGGSYALHDILVISVDSVYLATTNWFEGGGVYLTTDGGETSDTAGLYDYHVYALAKNSKGDVFAGTYSGNMGPYVGGIFVLRNGCNVWDSLYGGYVNDILINSDDYIFAAMPQGVLASFDDGQSFEFVNTGLFTEEVNNLAIDSNGYLYASSYYPRHLAKTLQTTVGIKEIGSSNIKSVYVFPNPFEDWIHFQLPYYLAYEEVDIKLFNNAGNCIHSERIYYVSCSIVSVSTSKLSLSSGTYYYKIMCSGNIYSGTLIKL